jgi:hypothetical protein
LGAADPRESFIMLDDKLLERFMKNFLGYGDINADVWFVGMEEGGGDTEENVRRRLETWEARGCRSIEDLAEYHQGIGDTKHFDGRKPPIQRTWAKICRMYLAQGARSPTFEEIRSFQKSNLGRGSSATCLLELMPLPSPSISDWRYGEWSGIGYLNTRDSYVKEVKPKRVDLLRRTIAQRAPKCVAFYGMKYRNDWAEIAQLPGAGSWAELAEFPGSFTAASEGTMYYLLPHPVAFGWNVEKWDGVGRHIQRNGSL